MSNNNPPFHVGQRVVCVESGRATNINTKRVAKVVKDHFYTIRKSYIFLGAPIVELNETPNARWCADRFVPIEPRHQDVEIVEELLRQPVEERLDAPWIIMPRSLKERM